MSKDPIFSRSLPPVNTADYIIYKDKAWIRAKSGLSGNIVFEDVDASSVIQKVFDKINENGGGYVHIKTGTYHISTSIIPYNKVKMKGDGIGNTILAGTSGLGGGAVIKGTTFTAGAPLTQFEIQDIEIDGTQTRVTICQVDSFPQ